MRRIVLPLLVVVGVLVAAPLAQASDAGLRKALKPYKARLTADIAYLASFFAPSKAKAAAALSKVSKIRKDLAGATRAANNNQGSTRAGRKGRALVLSGLHRAMLAAADARASAKAARSGKRSAAKLDAKHERSEINKAIPLFESGGMLLHLF